MIANDIREGAGAIQQRCVRRQLRLRKRKHERFRVVDRDTLFGAGLARGTSLADRITRASEPGAERSAGEKQAADDQAQHRHDRGTGTAEQLRGPGLQPAAAEATVRAAEGQLQTEKEDRQPTPERAQLDQLAAHEQERAVDDHTHR